VIATGADVVQDVDASERFPQRWRVAEISLENSDVFPNDLPSTGRITCQDEDLGGRRQPPCNMLSNETCGSGN
jgi:hypothetical protein